MFRPCSISARGFQIWCLHLRQWTGSKLSRLTVPWSKRRIDLKSSKILLTSIMVKPSLSSGTWIIGSLVDEILVWLEVRSSFTWTLIFLKWGSRGSTNLQFAPSEIAQDLLGTRISRNMLSRFCYPFCRYFFSSKVDIFLLQIWHKWRVQICARPLYLFIVHLSSATLEHLSMWWCLHRSRAG